ncbi:FAD-binding protein [Escherichia coli]|nr:FAD-binding protein [Escherichia coli]
MRKITTAEALAAQIQDGATIAISGNGGGMVEADHILAAIEARFLQTGHPRDLTLIHSLGIGDRDCKGTNRFAHAEMLKRIIAGHFTWSPKMQALVKNNTIEAYCFPGGVIQALLREIGAGRPGLFTHVGLGSFVDPRNGGGKSNECTTDELVELIEIDGETKLRYRPFKVDYAILRGTYADPRGNVSLEEEAIDMDSYSMALAAHNSGGKVFVQVRDVLEAGAIEPRRVKLPGILVDGIVEHREQPQTYLGGYDLTISGQHRRLSSNDAIELVSHPVRRLIARRAARELVAGASTNFGFGIPGGIPGVALREGVPYQSLWLSVEQGVHNGMMLDDAFFGCARNADAIIPSLDQFEFYSGGGIDITFLGMGEMDQYGNVNVSHLNGNLMLDDTILDALTHVTFPKGFAQAEPAWVVTVDGVDYPLWQTDALVVGSGAAGLRAAVELKRRQQNVLIATAGLYMGTSACSGSDKQTLFTAATAGNGDNFTKLAEALASGGAMDHDTAYVEAVGSLHTLGGLQYLGLELPEDRYGAILRYQTDHDEAGRATSCGPRTSRLMVKVLLEEVQRLAIPVLTSATVIKLLHQRDENGEDRVAGAILATGHRAHNPWGLAIVTAPNVVLATGGPGELYRDSVYPHKCFGSLGLALEEGLTLTNLTESQFGIGTPRSTFPWNLSGTYVQVIPYIYSVDAEGNEYNFLADYYRTTQELASNIFRKGYQWPFHSTRVMDFGSSLLDMAVAQEQQSGRQVFMDFNRNPEAVPGDLPFSLDRLDDDVRAYLENNDALAPSPIERLQRMNPLSISLYKMHGYDLTTQPLQFAMNNQHMNGGIEVDIWGQTSLPGCFAVGEVAGTHGVTRPGGAALNAGQVFAVRLARFIGCTQKRNIDGDIAQLVAPTLASIREIITQAHDNGTGMPLSVVREKIQARMSDHAGFICHADKVRRATRDALLLSEFVQRHGLAIKHVGEVAELFMWRHMALTSAAVLTQLTHYIDAGGGSRGARIILDRDGNSIPQTRNGFCDAWRFRSERTEDKKDKLHIHYCNGIFHVRETPVREFPIIRGIWFEKNWPGFLNGTIYQPQDE